MRPEADTTDTALVAARVAAMDARPGPRVGDFVRFACGTVRRISYHWKSAMGWDGGIQTSDTGSFHLGEHGVSFSGSLYRCVPINSLTETDERRDGAVWIFHHGFARAHSAVHFEVLFRVYACTEEASS